MERAWMTEELSRANFRTFQIDVTYRHETVGEKLIRVQQLQSAIDKRTQVIVWWVVRAGIDHFDLAGRSLSLLASNFFSSGSPLWNFSGCQFKATTTWPPFKQFLTNCRLLKQPSKFSVSPLPQSSTTECQSQSIRFTPLCLDTRQVTKPISRLQKDVLVDYACAPVCLRDYLIRER